ncbi:MAG: PilN domain-containing protein [Patescibacteria group bacterium]
MINLIPSNKKAELRAARTNVILVRYIVMILLALIFILGAMYVTRTVLGFTKANSESIIASNETKADIYSSTKAEVESLSASLTETKVLLDQEIRYSKVFVNIAQQMPEGTIFEKLTLDSASFAGTPITTKVYAKTSANAVSLREQFEKSPMFAGVSFQAISESGSTVEGYPVSVDITFTLTRVAAQ